MPANSEIILSNQQHQGDSSTQTVTGNAFKGDGYYGRSDGLHTVQYSFSGFTGTIRIQATLSVEPQEADWFTVHSYAAQQETSSKIASFVGNYVWIRASAEFTDGTINSIVLNH